MKYLKLFITVLILTGAADMCRAFQIQSGPEQVQLVELYSSEGCSSCPPADRWLSTFEKDKRLWKDYVPVAFHVDYWDYIGWKDRFADHQFTERQYAYSRQWRAGSVYTPGLVLNGSEWRGWRKHHSIPEGDKVKTGILTAESSGKKIRVTFMPESAGTKWTAHYALLGMNIPSQIKAGENSGKKLEHDFLVLKYQTQPMSSGRGRFEAEFNALLSEFPEVSKKAVAFWVSQDAGLTPIQSLGQYL